MKKIRFAFALGNNNSFEDVVFSDAIKYRIIEFDILSKELTIVSEEPNSSLHADTDEKSKILMDFLSERNVKLIVAKKFGLLVKLENKNCIPIIIKLEQPDEVLQLMLKHIYWLLDELSKIKNEFMVFKIDEGILKYKL